MKSLHRPIVRRNRQIRYNKRRHSVKALASLVALAMLLSVEPIIFITEANDFRAATVESGSGFLDHVLKPAVKKIFSGKTTRRAAQDPATLVDHIQLCPRNLSLYVGEEFTLVPIPQDAQDNPVQGVLVTWKAGDNSIVDVSTVGTVTALIVGNTLVYAQVGTIRATVNVTILAGYRKVQTDQDWDAEHADDCDNPKAGQLNNVPQINPATTPRIATSAPDSDHTRPERASASSSTSPASLARPASYSRISKPARAVRSRPASDRNNVAGYNARRSIAEKSSYAASTTSAAGLFQASPILDTGSPDATFSSALVNSPGNGSGSPRFGASERAQGSSTKLKNILASPDYVFTAPILALPGRGIGVGLAMAYNSQVWTMDSGGGMFFDINKGFPSYGWSLGYGRLIADYNNSHHGDASGSTSANYPGDYLLLKPDGTRTIITGLWDGTQFDYSSTDGSNITMIFNGKKIRYPDGTRVDFNLTNNKLLPAKVETRNGDMIGIAYRTKSAFFPVRWAIDAITDTMGRVVTFHYYGDTGYAFDTTSHPQYALAAITMIDQNGASEPLVSLDYTSVTLSWNFSGGVTVPAPIVNNTPIWVVNSIRYPLTGRGFLFRKPDSSSGYSSYGMAKYISVRQGMNGSGSYGTEVASTSYDYPDASAGVLNDAPQYTTRTESWTTTSATGTVSTTTGLYGYMRSRTQDGSSETTTVTSPDGTKVESTTDLQTLDAAYGKVTSVVAKNSSDQVISSVNYSYGLDGSGAFQPTQVMRSVDGSPNAITNYSYGSFGRLLTVAEKDFTGVKKRTTTYDYFGGSTYTDPNVNLVRLVKSITVTDNVSGQDIAKTTIGYDETALQDEPGVIGHDYSKFPATNLVRGNPTTMTQYVTVSPAQTIARTTQYDVFGNAIVAQVSCCNQKVFTYSSLTQFSQPDSERDGPTGGPNLTTNFTYNYNTSELAIATDPDGTQTHYFYDGAMRVTQVNSATGATTTTSFDPDANLNDQQQYSSRTTYLDADGTQKTVTSRTWFDGAGRGIRSGTGTGSAPTSFDATAVTYDSMGRPFTQSNPFSGNPSGLGGTPPPVSTNTYDALSRVTQVTLPDFQNVSTAYSYSSANNASSVTVTDQVGRERASFIDGLGRLIAVTEPDPATGNLSLTTNYTHDALNNLTRINLGGQMRTFSYDGLSRVTSATTPEAGTINYTYTDFDAIQTKTDTGRNFTVTYGYDGLNRLHTITYDLHAAVNVAPTTNVTISYNPSSPGIGQVASLTDGAGLESYSYDGFARLMNKTRTIDGNSYETQYQYNQINQLTLEIYPSGKRFRMDHDARGRISGEEQVNSSGGLVTTYINSTTSPIQYNSAQQITGLMLGNGVAESYSYSSDRLQLTNQTATKGGNTLMNLTYNYQSTGNQSGAGAGIHNGNSGQLMAISTGSTINGQARNETLTYDNVGRLVTAAGWGAWQRRYSYDRYGNRLGEWDATTGGNQLQSITIATTGGVSNNRIASVGSTNYTYDQSGNLTFDGSHHYLYDAEGRLAQVDANTANEADYSYDLNNWRLKKVTNAGQSSQATTYYVRESGRVIAEYSTAPAQNNGTRYYQPDQLSTRMITNTTGGVAGTEDTLPFGEDPGPPSTGTSGSGVTDPYRFTNYQRDPETGTDYAVNRQYSSALGRMQQPDVVGGSTGNPQSLNRYSYVVNDPANLTDPFGLDWMTDASVHGPGVYLDGVELMPEMWGAAFSLLSIDAAFAGTGYLWQNHRGEWILGDWPVDRIHDPLSILPIGFAFGPVIKHYAFTFPCNKSARDAIAKLRANYAKLAGGDDILFFALLQEFTTTVHYSGTVAVGNVIDINISVSYFMDPTDKTATIRSPKTSVTVTNIDSNSFTFHTNAGHPLDPGSITFSMADAGKGDVTFHIDVNANANGAINSTIFKLIGSDAEDAAWNNLGENVRKQVCGNK